MIRLSVNKGGQAPAAHRAPARPVHGRQLKVRVDVVTPRRLYRSTATADLASPVDPLARSVAGPVAPAVARLPRISFAPRARLSTSAGGPAPGAAASSSAARRPIRESATDSSATSISAELNKLIDSELQTKLKLAWPFGVVFLEKYGYDLSEMEDEVELTRTVNGMRVQIKFSAADEDDLKDEFKREVEGAPDADEKIKKMNETLQQMKSVSFVIGIAKPGASVDNVLNVFCEAAQEDHAIEITGLGGDTEATWGVGFESLGQPIKEKIIDYLIEFGIGPDLAQFVAEYKANMKGTNIPGLRRLKAFFADGKAQ